MEDTYSNIEMICRAVMHAEGCINNEAYYDYIERANEHFEKTEDKNGINNV